MIRHIRNILGVLAFLLAAAVAPSAYAQCRVEAFGDSLTAGILPLTNGASNGGYRGTLVYAPPAGVSLAMVGTRADYSPAWMGAQGWHSGFPGYRTDQLLGVVPYDYSYPNVILVHAGTNDILQGFGGYNAAVGLNNLVWALSNRWPAAKILVAKVIPIVFPSWHSNYPYNPAFAYEVGVLNAYVDSITAGLRANGRSANTVDLNTGFPIETLADGIHPVDSGYVWMASQWSTPLAAACH